MTTTDSFHSKMPTKEQFDAFMVNFESQNAERIKNAEYRMQNYFNCVDDYSWGGLCDQAADRAHSKRLRIKENLEHQLNHGAFTKCVQLSVLCDMAGNIVSDKIVNGKFGKCWLIKDGEVVSFVSVAKKQATYNKKGFKVMTLNVNVEYYYLTSGKVVSRILSQNMEEVFPEYQTTDKPDFLFFAN